MAALQEAAAQHMPGEDLQQVGNVLLERYQAEPFQKAVGSGRYANHLEVLGAIYDLIQGADLSSGPAGARVSGSGSSSSSSIHELPTPAQPGWQWCWLRPPVPLGKAALAAALAAPAAGGAGAATSDGAGSGSRGSRTRTGPSSEGLVRSFSGYTSATPVALGGGRYMLSLRMRLTGRLAGWGFRLWVCAAEAQQPAEQPGQQQQQQGEQQGEQQGLCAGDEQTQHLGARLSGLHVAPSSEDLDVLSGPMPLPGDLAPAPASPDTLASLGLDSVEAGVLLGLAMTAAAAAAAAGSSTQSPFNATHGSPHPVFFSPKSVGSKGSAEQRARKQARDGKSLLVDTGVGWCVLEPMPGKVEAPAGGSGTATAEPGSQSKRSRPSSAEPASLRPGSTGAAAAMAAAPAAAVAVGATAAGEEEVAAEVIVAASADACARPAAAMQGNTLPAARPASMQSTMGALSQRLQRLQLSPHKVLSLFQPPSNAAAATAAAQDWEQTMSDPTRAAQLRQLLLRDDLRDTKERNVLHLTAAGRRPAGLQQLQLDFLLQPDLLAKLQGQVNNNGSTPLLLAATWGQPVAYDRLLAKATPDVLYTFTQSGWSPLHRLAQSAADAASAADRERFLRCIRDTIDHLVAVELQEAAAAAAGQQQQPLQQAVAVARECVMQYVSAAPAPSRHYTGQTVLLEMNVVQMAVERFEAAAATVLAAAAAAGDL